LSSERYPAKWNVSANVIKRIDGLKRGCLGTEAHIANLCIERILVLMMFVQSETKRKQISMYTLQNKTIGKMNKERENSAKTCGGEKLYSGI
jgi:hypothetical protein